MKNLSDILSLKALSDEQEIVSESQQKGLYIGKIVVFLNKT